jgi:hypothetical protein
VLWWDHNKVFSALSWIVVYCLLPLNIPTMISVTYACYNSYSGVTVEGYHRHYVKHWILNLQVYSTCQRLQEMNSCFTELRTCSIQAVAVILCILDLEWHRPSSSVQRGLNRLGESEANSYMIQILEPYGFQPDRLFDQVIMTFMFNFTSQFLCITGFFITYCSLMKRN